MTIDEAIKNNDLQNVEALIDNINLQDENGNSPLHIAIVSYQLNIAKYLDLQNKNKYFPLHRITEMAQLDIAKCLIDKGADLNLKNKDGETPLFLAIKLRKPDIAKYLIDKKANIHLPNKNGDTSLHLAIKHRFFKIAECLIDKGANGNIKNAKGETPFDFAKQSIPWNMEQEYTLQHIMSRIKLQAVDAPPSIEIAEVSNIEIWKHNFQAQLYNAKHVNMPFAIHSFWKKPISNDHDEPLGLDANKPS